jgi:hypothetical protein
MAQELLRAGAETATIPTRYVFIVGKKACYDGKHTVELLHLGVGEWGLCVGFMSQQVNETRKLDCINMKHKILVCECWKIQHTVYPSVTCV